MRTLVYKRTHPGDPDERGIFGVEDCMGSVRGFDFESVIGIGGIGEWARSCEIDRKINWIGIGAHQVGWKGRGPLIAFERFALFEDSGEPVSKKAPLLAKRFCHSKAARYALHDFSEAEQAEIRKLLAMVKNKPPSKRATKRGSRRKCRPKCPPGRRC